MNVTREEKSFLKWLLARISRMAKREIATETYKPGGPNRDELVAMRRQRELVRGLLRKLEEEQA